MELRQEVLGRDVLFGLGVGLWSNSAPWVFFSAMAMIGFNAFTFIYIIAIAGLGLVELNRLCSGRKMCSAVLSSSRLGYAVGTLLTCSTIVIIVRAIPAAYIEHGLLVLFTLRLILAGVLLQCSGVPIMDEAEMNFGTLLTIRASFIGAWILWHLPRIEIIQELWCVAMVCDYVLGHALLVIWHEEWRSLWSWIKRLVTLNSALFVSWGSFSMIIMARDAAPSRGQISVLTGTLMLNGAISMFWPPPALRGKSPQH